jgi:hypothetical protein
MNLPPAAELPINAGILLAMATQRRLKLLISCLLAVLLVSGTALPSPALWQCHHSASVVNAAFTAAPTVMPCRMSEPLMPTMACCLSEHSPINPSFTPPPCHPTLIRLAILPALTCLNTQTRLRQNLVLLPSAFVLPAAFRPSAPIVLSLRQRPPPTIGLSQFSLEHTPGLRAPPAA